MTKAKINITIEPYILEQAKEKGFNISEVCERALIHKINPENDIDTTGTRCEYCGIIMRQATAKDMNGLFWFLPDEKWICPPCEHRFINELIISKSL